LAPSVWKTGNKFGKNCTNLSLKFGVLNVSEFEQRFFLPNVAWQKKFGEIDLRPPVTSDINKLIQIPYN